MVEHSKRRKFHDKDKYYRLAKEQGFRSRAAFKLAQINRRFSILQNARTVLDLCAAPGGWTQVCSRSLPGRDSATIVAVDVLPMRPMRNVITLVGDITTEKCKAAIRAEMQGAGADVVLCDGAPNVGASYDRDAYQQNELALHALRCASEHLRRGGAFVTKLYRSQDYSAYLWVAKQFFRGVQAVKPSASRSQSAEIFLVCQGYVAPDKIDPRMFDPRCVFEQVDGQATGGGDKSQTGQKAAKMNIFHKEFGKRVRSRNGYDMTSLDASMRNIGSVCEFLEGGSGNDPIRMLSDCTGLSFSCRPSSNCDLYLNHRLTTSEIKMCLSDLKVLNKADFKGLLTWRDKMRADQRAAALNEDNSCVSGPSGDESDAGLSSDAEERQVQSEIEQLRLKKVRERKRVKKKEREAAAKRRRRAAFGMDLNAVDVPDNDKIFSLATIASAADLEAAREVDLEDVAAGEVVGGGDVDGSDGEDGLEMGVPIKDDFVGADEDEHKYLLEAELDAAYDRYLSNTKDGIAKSGTKMAKRTKKLQRQKALEEAREDADMVAGDEEHGLGDARAYAELLKESNDDSDGDDDDEIDGHNNEGNDFIARDKSLKPKKAGNETAQDNNGPVPPSEAASKEECSKTANSSSKTAKTLQLDIEEEEPNPLIFKLADDSTYKTARWFSNPLFESIERKAASASFINNHADNSDVEEEEDEDSVQNLHSDDEDGMSTKKRRKQPKSLAARRSAESGNDQDGGTLNAEDIIASIPKTDKQRRHEKRLKSIERKERRNARREREASMGEGAFKVAPATDTEDPSFHDADAGDKKGKRLTDAESKKCSEARTLIKAGMGNTQGDRREGPGFEVVPSTADQPGPLPVLDTRKYDSDHEHYDDTDHAKTLALGTMILRRSKEKAMVDASYNRYAWNDPQDLPDWFVDDENKHYRPQLPIPPSLLDKVRAKYLHLATKPIAKVAEARARKGKMARTRLAAAKRKAEAVANSSEMSEAAKLKAISRAMRGKEASRPGKTYVVAKKGGGGRGGKGVQLVDKREKSDKRAMERVAKRKKIGKKGGLTGSKRRRHHR